MSSKIASSEGPLAKKIAQKKTTTKCTRVKKIHPKAFSLSDDMFLLNHQSNKVKSKTKWSHANCYNRKTLKHCQVPNSKNVCKLCTVFDTYIKPTVNSDRVKTVYKFLNKTKR